MPRVSIVILSHRANLLPEAFASAHAQTYRDREIIVKYAEGDAWWPEKINEGICGSSGELFCLLCDDDQLAPTWLAETVAALDREHTDIAYTDNFVFGMLPVRFALPDFSLEAVRRDCVPHFTALTKRALWERLGGYDGTQPYTDWDFWLAAAKAAATAAHVRDYLMRYRVWQKNESRGLCNRDALNALRRKHADLVLPAGLAA